MKATPDPNDFLCIQVQTPPIVNILWHCRSWKCNRLGLEIFPLLSICHFKARALSEDLEVIKLCGDKSLMSPVWERDRRWKLLLSYN